MNGDRLWRKNRRLNTGSTCRGVDQNRNYDSHWNEVTQNTDYWVYHIVSGETKTFSYFEDKSEY